MTKQTAANNKHIAAVKKIFNAKVTKRFSEILNSQGEDAAYTYMQGYFAEGIDARQRINA